MALPLDNPSYFTIASGTHPGCSAKGKFSLFKKKMSAQEIICEPSTSAFKPLLHTNGFTNTNARIPLRTLLRSVSSTSAESNQELLVLGEPRPSDIAPRSPYLSSHRDDPSRLSKKGKRPKNETMSTISNDLMYCPLATSEDAVIEIDGSEEEEEEVFLMEDSAKYYNLSARDTNRRHSIGTFLMQERERAMSTASSSKSYREDLLQVHATIDGEVVKPSTSYSSDVGIVKASTSFSSDIARPSTSYSSDVDFVKPSTSICSDTDLQVCVRHSRRRCPRCTVKGVSNSLSSVNMDDILIVSSKSSQAASLWVNYFGTCFDQISRQKNRPALKVFHLGIEEVIEGTGLNPELAQRVSSVKLHVIIVCPHFLEYVATDPQSSSNLCNLLKPDRTIAMLLGVLDNDLMDIHHQALVSYRQWKRHQVGQDQDQDFARDFLSAAMGILTKVARQQHAAALEERTAFSVMPKKVKHSQNRLVVLLAEPLNKDDNVRVSIDKNGDLIEVKPVKRRNPYTLKFTMPDRCLEVSSIVNVLVEKNGNMLGARPVKCESRLRELDQVLRSVNDPIEFMCQTLGFSPSNTEQLDNWMVHAFQKNLPPHFNLLSMSAATAGVTSRTDSHLIRQNSTRHPHSHEEFPTLLHFAAKYGLERLAWQLLECSGAEAACDIRNAADLTPAEISENTGHNKLASALRGYMQMNEFTNMYSQLKELSQVKPTAAPDVDEDEYLLPRGAGEQKEMNYSIPPPARPYSPATQTPTNINRPITGYLEMQPATKQTNAPNLSGRSTPLGRITPISKQPDQISNHSSKSITPLPSNDSQEPTKTNEKHHVEAYEDKVQGELLEIINDFKNNVFTLNEVEKLVDNWRNRNDVQKSFKEKEEQLNVMRREYERIQQMMKEEMKRPTPFDRIRKLFSRSPRNKDMTNTITVNRDIKFDTSSINSDDKVSTDGATNNIQNHLRPISSLSLQSTASSSSSGRMSTLSGCSATSLGDSGTHSDHEDRKHLMRQTSSDHEYFEINEPKKNSNFNYLIPPTPKPVYKSPSLKTTQQFSTITERPPHPTPRIETPTQDEYYIQFPPSGLPVTTPLQSENKPISRSPSPLPPSTIEEPLAEYLTMDEPRTDYINLPAATEMNNQSIDQISNEQLPEYINFQPTNTATLSQRN